MFKILDDQYVQLMLSLVSERSEKLQNYDFSGIDMQKLFDLCTEHELQGVAASHIIKYGLFDLPEYWEKSYNSEKERLTFLKEKSVSICSIMKQNGIPMIILKNGGIMADIESDAGACPMEDIDSLVRKCDFIQAHKILLDNGFNFKFRSEFEKEELEEAFADGSTEYYINMPDGEKMWFELAWRAVSGRWIRPDKEPDTDKMFERCHCAPGSDVGVLSPEDNLLQVCIHTAKHSYVRAPGLRLHLDVERIVSNCKIDWKQFMRLVEEAHVKTSTYYSLMIPKKIFNTEIPDYILEMLKPKARKAKRIEKLLAKAGLLHPKAAKFPKMEFLRFQTSIYDSTKDGYRVLYPSYEWYKERYGISNRLSVIPCMVRRGLDLVGIRKKK